MSNNMEESKKVSNKAVKLALCIILAGVTSMSITACGKTVASTQITEEQGTVSYEEEKLNDMDSIVEDEVEKEVVVLEEYDGNRYENQFLGLRLRYPENWFTTDSYDVLLNVMKDLGVNDKLDLSETKLKDILNIVTFESNDTYMNTIDIVAIPSLDKIAGDLAQTETTVETDVTTQSEDKKYANDTTKKEASTNITKDKESNQTTTSKETTGNTNTSATEKKAIPKFTESDLKVIKESVILSMGDVENMVSCEEPYLVEIGGKEVAMIEFISSIYGQELSMVSAFLNLGENYLMITSASLNEPNDIDKIYNIEDIISTLEIGFSLSEIQEPLLAPVKEQTDEEVLEALNSEVEYTEVKSETPTNN